MDVVNLNISLSLCMCYNTGLVLVYSRVRSIFEGSCGHVTLSRDVSLLMCTAMLGQPCHHGFMVIGISAAVVKSSSVNFPQEQALGLGDPVACVCSARAGGKDSFYIFFASLGIMNTKR